MMQKLLLSIGIAFAAIGCTKDPYGTQSGDDALTITSNITTRVSDGQWDEKDAIGVYMTGEGVSSESANVEYTTADGDGTFTSSTPLYLPSSGSVEIFAYYPYVAEVDLAAYPIKSAEQVDLLSATATSVTSPSVALEFNHLLSKVSLTIENGEGLETADLAGLDVTISGISTEATFDVSEGEVNTLGEASALSLTTATEGTSSSAIVIPQTLSDATLYFDTKDYGTFSATLSTTEFKVGMEYKYTATLNCNGVEITSSNISGWGPNDAESGTASIVDIEYKSADDKYYINSAKGLAAFRDLVNDGGTNTQSATFAGFESSAFAEANLEIDGVLTRDIDLSDICNAEDGTSWAAIGNYTTQENPYNGTFDGGGFEISGLYINTALNQQGLFRRINTAGEVYNLG
ncbi:MAG: fimbrillin family protein, partial [Rikenellaceae bacterium]